VAGARGRKSRSDNTKVNVKPAGRAKTNDKRPRAATNAKPARAL
jgi:hypothetical protein